MTTFVSAPDHIDVHLSGWIRLPSGVEITRLPLWDSEEQLFARRGPGTSEDWCRGRGWRLPTVAELDELHSLALHIEPVTLPTVAMLQADRVCVSSTDAIDHYRNTRMRSRAWCAIHDREVFERLRTAGWTDEPVANAGKHWIANRTIYGWWRRGQPMIQAPSRAHAGEPGYTDYATTTHAVRGGGGKSDQIPPTVMLGDDGPAVGRWQRVLAASEKPIAWTTARGAYRQWPDTWRWPLVVDDDFGPRTAAATECWQSRRGLVADAIVGAKTWAASLAVDSIPPPPDTLPAPPPSLASATGSWRVTPGIDVLDRIVFREAKLANFRRGRQGGMPTVLMVHTAETVETSVVAENLQTWDATAEPRVSWHYAIDDDSITQSVREEDTAYACPAFNARGIHIELGGRAIQGRSGWADDYSVAVVRNAIALSRAILARHPVIRPVKINYIDLVEELPGICGHYDGTLALAEARRCNLKRAPWWDSRPGKGWKTSTHVDPGPDWPWDEFLAAVRA